MELHYQMVTGPARAPVRLGRMPAFQPPPEIVTWGSRYFTLLHNQDGTPYMVDGGRLVYAECLGVWSADAEVAA